MYSISFSTQRPDHNIPMNSAADCAPISPARSLMLGLRELQNDTHMMIDRLATALQEVLTPEPPSKLSNENAGTVAASPLCEELSQRCDVERAARERIQALIDRLTV